MLKIFKNEKFLYALGGAVAIIVGKKIVTANKTRQLVVSGYDAKSEAGLNDEEVTE